MQILPSFASIRFSCPYCGALAHQYWANCRANWLKKDVPPFRGDTAKLQELCEAQKDLPKSERSHELSLIEDALRATSGEVFVSSKEKTLSTIKFSIWMFLGVILVQMSVFGSVIV